VHPVCIPERSVAVFVAGDNMARDGDDDSVRRVIIGHDRIPVHGSVSFGGGNGHCVLHSSLLETGIQETARAASNASDAFSRNSAFCNCQTLGTGPALSSAA